MLDGIDAHTINIILFHQASDPLVHSLNDRWVFRVQVRQRKGLVSNPALLDVRLVIVVLDQTEWVIIRRGREWRNFRVIERWILPVARRV